MVCLVLRYGISLRLEGNSRCDWRVHGSGYHWPFVGANVLSVGYKLFLAWLHGADAVDQKGLAISSGAIRG